MTVKELIEELEDMDEKAEVRLAMQPSWPFEYSLGDVVEVNVCEYDDEDLECAAEEITEAQEDLDMAKAELDQAKAEGFWAEDVMEGHRDAVEKAEGEVETAEEGHEGIQQTMDDAAPVVYIGEGSQLAYLNANVADELGWSRR